MQTLLNILTEFWAVLAEMAPYLLLGFFVAGVLSVALPTSWINKHLGGNGFVPVIKSSALGVPLPLCSCGVIPVAAGLRRSGASRASVVAFLLSTPQTGVDSILVTLSLMGPLYAIYRPIAALATGLAGGAATMLAHDRGSSEELSPADKGHQPGVDPPPDDRPKGLWPKAVEAVRYGFITLPADIGRALLIGLLIAGAITVAIPPHFIADNVGTGLGSMLVLMLLGVPIYVCATASIPIAAALILHQGVSPGAALAFLMTGPATNAATIATIFKTMGAKTVAIYLATVIVAAVVMGLLLDGLFGWANTTPSGAGLHEMAPGAALIQTLSAIVLLVLIAVGLGKPILKRKLMGDKHMAGDVTLKIEGMTCSHCVGRVEKTLQQQPGVASAKVDLESGKAAVRGDQLDPEALARSVEGEGYKAQPL